MKICKENIWVDQYKCIHYVLHINLLDQIFTNTYTTHVVCIPCIFPKQTPFPSVHYLFPLFIFFYYFHRSPVKCTILQQSHQSSSVIGNWNIKAFQVLCHIVKDNETNAFDILTHYECSLMQSTQKYSDKMFSFVFRMASLLSKFRIKFADINIICDINMKPNKER